MLHRESELSLVERIPWLFSQKAQNVLTEAFCEDSLVELENSAAAPENNMIPMLNTLWCDYPVLKRTVVGGGGFMEDFVKSLIDKKHKIKPMKIQDHCIKLKIDWLGNVSFYK